MPSARPDVTGSISPTDVRGVLADRTSETPVKIALHPLAGNCWFDGTPLRKLNLRHNGYLWVIHPAHCESRRSAKTKRRVMKLSPRFVCDGIGRHPLANLMSPPRLPVSTLGLPLISILVRHATRTIQRDF